MTIQTFSIIQCPHAGDLSRQLQVLKNVGLSDVDFMSDLLGVLRYKDDFTHEQNIFLDELIWSTYYHEKLSHGNLKQFGEYTSRFMEETALLSKRITNQLYQHLLEKGMYDKKGKFPHEFHSFDGRAISLRNL